MATVLGFCAMAQANSEEVFTALAPEARSYEYPGAATSGTDSWGTSQTNNDEDGWQVVRFHVNADGSITQTPYLNSFIPDLKPKQGGATHGSLGLSGNVEQVWPLQGGIVLFTTETNYNYLYKLNTATGTVGNNPPNYDNKQAVMNMGERNNVPQADIRALHHRSLLESNITAPNGSKVLFYGEYNISDQEHVGLWKSTDTGTTWSKVIEWNTVGHQARHTHGVVQNPYNNWIYILFGDDDTESAIVAWDGVSAAPPNNTSLDQIGAKKANGQPMYPGWKSIAGSQSVRTGDLVFTPPPPNGNGKCVWIPDVDSLNPGEKLYGQRANYDLTGLETTGEIPYVNDFPPILGARSNTGNIYWASFRIEGPAEKKIRLWKSIDNGLNWMLAGKATLYTNWTIMPQNLRVYGTTTASEITDFLSINGRDLEFVPNGERAGSTAKFSSKTILATGGLPVTNPDTAATPKGQTVQINLTANDTNVGTSTVNIVNYPDFGNVAFVGTSKTLIAYTPNTGFTGQDTFSYNLKNASGTSNTSTVTITVTSSGGTVPVTNPDTATTPKGQSVQINLTANDTNVGTSTLNIASNPGHGNVVVGANNVVTYTPAAGFAGQDTFTYNLSNASGTSNTSTVTVTVTDTSSTLPVANPDVMTTPRNQPVTLNLTSNDTNVGTSTVNIVGYPDYGNVAYSDSTRKSITYTPNTGFSGQDSFTYNLKSSSGTSNTAAVTITVQ
jgi:heme/copper-type cytochrome/quinol oxidase subunit 2